MRKPLAKRPPVPAQVTTTESQAIQRKRVALRLITSGAGHSETVDYLQAQFPSLTENQARETYRAVMVKFRDDYELETQYFRASAIKRAQSDLLNMRNERIMSKEQLRGRRRPTWNDIYRAEAHLARLQGTLAPVELKVSNPNAVMSENLVRMIGDMTPEEIDDIIAEGEAV